MSKELCERLQKLEGEINALLKNRPCSCDERKRNKSTDNSGNKKPHGKRSSSAPGSGAKRNPKQQQQPPPRKNVNNPDPRKRDQKRLPGSYPGSRSTTPDNAHRKNPKVAVPPAERPPSPKKNKNKLEPDPKTDKQFSEMRPCVCCPAIAEKLENAIKNRGIPGTPPAKRRRPGTPDDVSAFQLATAINICKCKMQIQILAQLEEERTKRLQAEELAAMYRKRLIKPKTVDGGTVPSDTTIDKPKAVKDTSYKIHEDKSVETILSVQDTEDIQKKLDDLENHNEFLRRSLEEEVRIRSSSLDEARRDIKKTKKALKQRVGKMQMKAIKSVEKMAGKNEQLAQVVKDKDEHLRRLSEVSETLAKEVRAREDNCKAIREENDKLRAQLQEAKNKNKRLEEANDKMAKSVKEAVQRMETARKETEKLNKCNAEQKNEIKKTQGEVERLKKRMFSRPEASVHKERETMEKRVKEARERVRASMEETDSQKLKMIQLQNECAMQKKELEKEVQRLVEENRRLRERYERLLEKTKQDGSEMKKKQETAEEKKDQLKTFVKQLQDANKTQQKRIDELTEMNKQQEVLIQSQKSALESKDEQIRLAEEENELLRKKCTSLEQSVESLRAAAEMKEMRKATLQADLQKEIDAMARELDNARKMVQEVEDQILIKQKIIEDQVNTIDRQKTELEKKSFELQKAKEDSKKDLSDMKQLQEDAFNKKLAEMKKAHEEVLKKQLAEMKKTQEEVKAKADEYKRKTEELEKAKTPTRNANVEVGEKEAVNKDIAQVNEENLRLERQVEEVEKTLQQLCRRCCAGDMEKRHLLITYLEQQVALQQKEWELQKQVMCKEKCRALHAAHFATQKLLETVDDFQNQVETQKRVQRMLAGMLQEKEEKLRVVSSQMASRATLPKRVGFGELPKKEVNEVCYKTIYQPQSRSSIYSPYSSYVFQQIEDPSSAESYQTVSSSSTNATIYQMKPYRQPAPAPAGNRNPSIRLPAPQTPPPQTQEAKCCCARRWR